MPTSLSAGASRRGSHDEGINCPDARLRDLSKFTEGRLSSDDDRSARVELATAPTPFDLRITLIRPDPTSHLHAHPSQLGTSCTGPPETKWNFRHGKRVAGKPDRPEGLQDRQLASAAFFIR